LIALAADEIVLDGHAALGPVDPQLGQYPAASLVEVASMPGEHEDQTLILADVGRKALVQVEAVARELLQRHSDPQRARDVARLLSQGTWTHDHPLMASDLERLGLPVRVGVPPEERALMKLYPQPGPGGSRRVRTGSTRPRATSGARDAAPAARGRIFSRSLT
jgi:ClpP class serine protease